MTEKDLKEFVEFANVMSLTDESVIEVATLFEKAKKIGIDEFRRTRTIIGELEDAERQIDCLADKLKAMQMKYRRLVGHLERKAKDETWLSVFSREYCKYVIESECMATQEVSQSNANDV